MSKPFPLPNLFFHPGEDALGASPSGGSWRSVKEPHLYGGGRYFSYAGGKKGAVGWFPGGAHVRGSVDSDAAHAQWWSEKQVAEKLSTVVEPGAEADNEHYPPVLQSANIAAFMGHGPDYSTAMLPNSAFFHGTGISYFHGADGVPDDPNRPVAAYDAYKSEFEASQYHGESGEGIPGYWFDPNQSANGEDWLSTVMGYSEPPAEFFLGAAGEACAAECGLPRDLTAEQTARVIAAMVKKGDDRAAKCINCYVADAIRNRHPFAISVLHSLCSQLEASGTMMGYASAREIGQAARSAAVTIRAKAVSAGQAIKRAVQVLRHPKIASKVPMAAANAKTKVPGSGAALASTLKKTTPAKPGAKPGAKVSGAQEGAAPGYFRGC